MFYNGNNFLATHSKTSYVWKASTQRWIPYTFCICSSSERFIFLLSKGIVFCVRMWLTWKYIHLHCSFYTETLWIWIKCIPKPFFLMIFLYSFSTVIRKNSFPPSLRFLHFPFVWCSSKTIFVSEYVCNAYILWIVPL